MSDKKYTGEVVYMYAFDVAYDMKRGPIPSLLGQSVAQFEVDTSRRNPRHLPFYRPAMVRLPALEGNGPQGAIRVDRTIKLFPVGAISITLRVPFAVDHFEQLIAYHDLHIGSVSINDEARKLAQEVLRELVPYLDRPVQALRDEEAYTVFCVRAAGVVGGNMEEWMTRHRRQVAGLLTQEEQSARLSDQEAMESTQLMLSYYEHDLTVIDWDAALVIDSDGGFDQVIHIMELANVQLSELETYDQILDEALERSYRDLARRGRIGGGNVLGSLREIRVDMARLSDELSNTTKFFGDWHLARVYQYLASRFHLADWHREIEDKLKTLDSLYQILKQDQMNKWMIILEAAIVLLFILDLVILVALSK